MTSENVKFTGDTLLEFRVRFCESGKAEEPGANNAKNPNLNADFADSADLHGVFKEKPVRFRASRVIRVPRVLIQIEL